MTKIIKINSKHDKCHCLIKKELVILNFKNKFMNPVQEIIQWSFENNYNE